MVSYGFVCFVIVVVCRFCCYCFVCRCSFTICYLIAYMLVLQFETACCRLCNLAASVRFDFFSNSWCFEKYEADKIGMFKMVQIWFPQLFVVNAQSVRLDESGGNQVDGLPPALSFYFLAPVNLEN